ncbi:DUF1127 domain-containing protein [Roseibium marinum]|uniref:Uncharacterized protein YjiS (DUF1127 family) n=1 Tax=Roseibium marinum TaxID=281252 RepID=A0A2S3UKA3_9HYPH|nr:DUF1127 domain-containing protein [Roseibium marinum]POF28095.1 uncharacterized protein YjiS (DUF1127 family) [Roseibium marinum]
MSSIETIGGRRISRVPAFRSLIAFLLRKVAGWRRTARTRSQLLELSDAALEDLGLTAETARQEAERPFWDTRGETWRRFR